MRRPPRSQRRFLVLALAAAGLALAACGAARPTALSAAPLARHADTEPPSVPQGMAFAGRTRTTVSLIWRAATDNVAVRGYRLFTNNRVVANVTALRYTFRALRCGTSYSFALAAVDTSGNASFRPEATGRTATSPCAAPPGKPKPQPGPKPAATARPTVGLAHIWVDTNGGSCRRQPMPRSYVDGSACASLTAAYGTAAAKDTIAVAGGTYGRQVVPAGAKVVTIRNAPGATPVFGTTTVAASNVTLIGVRIQRHDSSDSKTATLEAGGDNNVFVGVRVNTQNVPNAMGIFVGGDNNTFRGGSTYNVVDERAALSGATKTTFDHYDFYNVVATNELVHNECVYSNGPGLTVRNSHFWNCATMDLFITRGDWWGQPFYGGITLENNVFEHTMAAQTGRWHPYGLGINGNMKEMRSWRVVNNTFETAVLSDDIPAPGTIWANNVGDWVCYDQATFSHNIGKKCGASDKPISSTRAIGWVSPSTHDFRLMARSPAVNAADPRYAPARDRTGTLRQGRPDAGALEYRP